MVAVAEQVRLLLNVPQVAHALGLGTTAVYDLINSGQLPSVMIGRSRRVAIRDLEDFIEKQRVAVQVT